METKSDFILSKLPPITDVFIVDCMTNLEEINNGVQQSIPLLVNYNHNISV